MSFRLKPSADWLHVVIAGGGVAGLEALIMLRSQLGDRAQLTMISPEQTFAYRPLSIPAVFGAAPAPPVEIGEVARANAAGYRTDSVVSVDPARHRLMLSSGDACDYDLLLLAPGALPEESVPGAIAFGASGGSRRFANVLEQAEHGGISRIVFAVPDEVGWPLPLYELALLTSARIRGAGADVELTLPERAPLAIFGGRASGAVLEELEQHGIHFVAGVHPDEVAWGELRARPRTVRVRADAVITLPRLRGPAIHGLPGDERGFLPVDAHGLVHGLTDVYAAGDAIAFPVKHGSLAAQQAVAAAEAIAARLGAAITPEPLEPVLRGIVLTGGEPCYLEAALDSGADRGATVSSRPLWWPPAKIAAPNLAPYLSGRLTGPPTDGIPIELPIDGPG